MVEKILIKNGIIITLDDDHRIIEDGAVLIEDDKIIDVGRTDQVQKAKVDKVIDAKKKAILPGLVDLHYHSSIGKGVCDWLPLGDFLNKFWYPKIRAMTPEEAYWAALCGYSEAIKSGTTSVNDQWRQMQKCADAAKEIGIRATLSCDVALDEEKLDTLDDNERLYREKNGTANGRIDVYFGIEWVPIASRELLAKTRELANKYKTGIHIHLAESLGEVEVSKQKFGRRPVELAYDMGVLGSDCVAAHCVWLTDAEIRLFKETGTSVSHNPGSNAKLGNGVARAPDLLAAGVNVGLGHDSATCNNSLDLFEAMKWASSIHRAVRVDASVMPAETVLEMATRNGGKALHHNTGSIELGKKADLIIVNLASQHFTPLVLGEDANLLSHLVYAAHGEDVETTIVDGKVVMENRIIKTIDENKVIEKADASFHDLYDRIEKTWRK